MGEFPLWTRKDGFGVITVFRGREEQPYIENDRIPAGAIAYFNNSPNLRILEYQEGKADIIDQVNMLDDK